LRQSRRKLEELLWVTGTHAVARTIYGATTGRQARRNHSMLRNFYGRLLPRGTLVFDIGANLGSYAAILASLGAKVIALEPNPDCIRHIHISYPRARIETLQAVAGPEDGLSMIRLSDERDDISSLSNEWIAAMQREHDEYRDLWSRQISVPMLKLDTLIKHYGFPHFIKIDVEGFEEHVLDGLSSQPPLLSFEFNTAYMSATLRCVSKRLFAPESLFNLSVGEPTRLELANWVRKEQIVDAVRNLGHGDRYGDIFVRLPAV